MGKPVLGVATRLRLGCDGLDLPVLNQPEHVAIGVGEGGHEATATNVAGGLLDGRARG
ncbi:MAG: hypothetical protein JO181_03845, partial [Solirubrobacterales bacterium]|nr:hypothetical protein [Solirubrobacterales bacterium]